MFNKFMSFYKPFFTPFHRSNHWATITVQYVYATLSRPSLSLSHSHLTQILLWLLWHSADFSVLTLCNVYVSSVCAEVHVLFLFRDKILNNRMIAAYECVYIFIGLRALLLYYNVAEPCMYALLIFSVSFSFVKEPTAQSHSVVLIKQTDQLKLLQHSVIHT